MRQEFGKIGGFGAIAVPVAVASILCNGIMVDFDNNEYGNPLLCLCSRLANDHKNPMIHAVSSLGRHTVFVMGFDYFAGSLAGFFTAWWYLFFLIKS